MLYTNEHGQVDLPFPAADISCVYINNFGTAEFYTASGDSKAVTNCRENEIQAIAAAMEDSGVPVCRIANSSGTRYLVPPTAVHYMTQIGVQSRKGEALTSGVVGVSGYGSGTIRCQEVDPAQMQTLFQAVIQAKKHSLLYLGSAAISTEYFSSLPQQQRQTAKTIIDCDKIRRIKLADAAKWHLAIHTGETNQPFKLFVPDEAAMHGILAEIQEKSNEALFAFPGQPKSFFSPADAICATVHTYDTKRMTIQFKRTSGSMSSNTTDYFFPNPTERDHAVKILGLFGIPVGALEPHKSRPNTKAVSTVFPRVDTASIHDIALPPDSPSLTLPLKDLTAIYYDPVADLMRIHRRKGVPQDISSQGALAIEDVCRALEQARFPFLRLTEHDAEDDSNPFFLVNPHEVAGHVTRNGRESTSNVFINGIGALNLQDFDKNDAARLVRVSSGLDGARNLTSPVGEEMVSAASASINRESVLSIHEDRKNRLHVVFRNAGTMQLTLRKSASAQQALAALEGEDPRLVIIPASGRKHAYALADIDYIAASEDMGLTVIFKQASASAADNAPLHFKSASERQRAIAMAQALRIDVIRPDGSDYAPRITASPDRS